MNNPKICDLLGLNINEPFNIDGQYLSNPYMFKKEGTFIYLVNGNGEECHNWVICMLLEGTMSIIKSN